MAKTPFNVTIDQTTPTTYTVPSGKIAVFAARFIREAPSSAAFYGTLSNGAAVVAQFYISLGASTGTVGSSFLEAKPLTANAGDVLSCTGTGAVCVVGISGFLYDIE